MYLSNYLLIKHTDSVIFAQCAGHLSDGMITFSCTVYSYMLTAAVSLTVFCKIPSSAQMNVLNSSS